jgi:hypothetical protein
MSVRVSAIDHIVINVGDVARSAEWCQEILGMEIKIFDPGPGKTLHLYNASEERLKRMKAPRPVNEIGKTRSVLTMVGGKVVYASGPYANLASEASR